MNHSKQILQFLFLTLLISGLPSCFGGGQVEEPLPSYTDENAEQNSESIDQYTNEANLVQESNIDENSEEEQYNVDDEYNGDDELANSEADDENIDEIIEDGEDIDELVENSEINAELEKEVENLEAPTEITNALEDEDKSGDQDFVDPAIQKVTSSEGRVVRFVKEDDTKVFSETSTSSSVISSHFKGDQLVVKLIANGWAEISAGRYIAAERLSSQIVPRIRRQTQWKN